MYHKRSFSETHEKTIFQIMATKHVDMDMQIRPQWQILTVYIQIDILVQFYTGSFL